ncbi:exodeoxyribonuclease VII large subunit [Pyxidicoccus parkwayensis]|uniref:Exodeoxyribonuclease 7 large subunit n=1 Tax=Pyxidicoccus parkwayensis TaxID=2813578 RepID=A0ABX7P3K4_9BACT|nr:exodeoxyribonuclease VII large subunit [Pyxidicoccus parkwaysis]QSQ25054.1 exodeoxyribonuclease VII large subunit [Pyxidicoccus parkwaysis]
MKKPKGGLPPPPPPGLQGDLFGAPATTPPAALPAPSEEAPPRGRVVAMPRKPPVDADGTSLLGPMEGAPPPPPKPERSVLSVGELTRQLKQTLESRFARVIVRGEVTGFRGPNARGHWYFSLKDSSAAIDTKVWASLAGRLRFMLRDGMEVIAEGSVDLYEPQGRYSLIVQRMEPVGEGALALAFEQLKARLADEGLIGDRRVRPPRPLPFLPRRIGIVTSRTGAALQDFLRVLHSRNPRQSVLLADARVQGEGSAEEVARAIERLTRTDVDVIVVTRGGGSVEDLWTFNEERVARAIFASPVPVVSAIGHEIDFTISDFVADWRAPTPSAAAERLAPVLADLELSLATQAGRLRRATERRVLELREELGQLSAHLEDPRRAINHQRLHLSEQVEAMMRVLRPAVREHRDALRALSERLQRVRPQARLGEQRAHLLKLAMRLTEAARAGVASRQAALAQAHLGLERASPAARVSRERARLAAHRARLLALQQGALADAQRRFQRLEGRLDAMSPLKVMSRGYSVVFRQRDGAVVRTSTDVQVGERLGIKLAMNGAKTLGGCEEVEATVTGVKGPVDC